MLFTKRIDTPLGVMLAAATDEGICVFDFEYRKMINEILNRVIRLLDTDVQEGEHEHFKVLEQQMKEYFEGERKEFDLPLQLLGTPFQQKVWVGLQEIPYATTRSYKAQSVFLGDVKAIRAVARANGENGLAIIVPCHRVIGENGSLVGYGGGLWCKKWLLDHERKHSGQTLQTSLFV
ncbi:MAG TPA: methylated-DNA--[protein]-cysteine S-methyltransferase [Flavipsychrobacter sp.]|nr:methylated-DNA--[protein]-cysteine S-methyltransferase [Flavipsychrobacter sp.]